MVMNYHIPEPFQFNPLKHHLAYIREFTIFECGQKRLTNDLIKELRKTGTSVMDVYTGNLKMNEIFSQIHAFLEQNGLKDSEMFGEWAGRLFSDHRIIHLSDGSQWVLKYHNNLTRYVHLFPARSSPHTFRIKSNTLKSSILYEIVIGKDYITEEDLNKARSIAKLSPIKEVAESEAISEMIDLLR